MKIHLLGLYIQMFKIIPGISQMNSISLKLFTDSLEEVFQKLIWKTKNVDKKVMENVLTQVQSESPTIFLMYCGVQKMTTGTENNK